MKSLTIKELLNAGTKKLKNFEKEEVSARYLMAQLLECEPGQIPLHWQNRASSEIIEKFNGLIKRRCANEPLQYILGEWGFLDLKIKVSPGVLIPRPETEEFVINLFDFIYYSGLSQDFCFADICTGSGIIGISVAKKFSEAKGWLSDISRCALEQAKENISINLGNTDRIKLIESDLLSCFSTETLDLIVSNPPYVKASEMPDLMAEVKDFEPSIALDGGFDGLDFIRRIFAEAAIKLKKTGILAFEHGHGQREAILSLPEVGNNFECKVFGKDLCARERFLIFTRRKK